jgi:protoporphyrin/coproporphyrin ferrochelatase
LMETGRLIVEQLGIENWKLVYQSRSGSPQQPWLGPDVCDYLRQLRDEDVSDVVVAPIGFVSDHMEVIYDLDVEAQKLSQEIGLSLVRAATAGTHPKFVNMIRELILEKTNNEPARFAGVRGALNSVCAVDCCLTGT